MQCKCIQNTHDSVTVAIKMKQKKRGKKQALCQKKQDTGVPKLGSIKSSPHHHRAHLFRSNKI